MVRREFGGLADRYDTLVDDSIAFSGLSVDLFTAAKADVLLQLAAEHVGDPSGLRVLDVGCGVGLTLALVAPRVREAHGVDLAQDTLTAAQQREPRAHTRVYDGHTLPYPDDGFDVAYAINVLHHVPVAQWERFTQEMVRVVRPGGLVVVMEHNPLNPATRLAVARCAFDDDAVLLPRRRTRALLAGPASDIVEERFILFFPLRGAVLRRIERHLGWLPLGAQYAVAARKRQAAP